MREPAQIVTINRFVREGGADFSIAEYRYLTEHSRAFTGLVSMRNGELVMWPAAQYKDVLSKRQSPKALGAPREEEILLMDFASPTQAIVKVRVRINSAVFVDYLTWHVVDGDWRITSMEWECGICHGSGKAKDGTRDCKLCKGAGWKLLGERRD